MHMQENESADQLKTELKEIIDQILPPDENAMQKAREHQAKLAKPIGSLGRLEDLSIQLSGITGKVHNTLEKKALLTFCADNGVVEEGISISPQSVTLAQAVNLTNGRTGAGVLASSIGCDIYVYDVGINGDVRPLSDKVIDKKIAYGTKNITKGAAMTRNQALCAILTGIQAVKEVSEKGVDVIGVGELGIGNTTTSAAVLSVLSGLSAKDVTGRGGGLTDDGYLHKINVIEQAIQFNRPDPADILDVLTKVSGFDIAAMTGAFLGAASMRIPAVIDGFISAVAALCAVKLCPLTVNNLIPSHASFEIGYKTAMESMGLKPLFDLEMRLGEGSGCPIAMSILDAACSIMNHMATFEEAGINDDYLDELRSIDAFSVPVPPSHE